MQLAHEYEFSRSTVWNWEKKPAPLRAHRKNRARIRQFLGISDHEYDELSLKNVSSNELRLVPPMAGANLAVVGDRARSLETELIEAMTVAIASTPADSADWRESVELVSRFIDDFRSRSR